jgi:predicted dehydrogenase/threonine dehydrogenase-like Zn-dependent dehydrogenase
MLQVIQSYRTGSLEVVEVPDPSISRGRILVRTGASIVSAGTERHLVEMAQKSLVGKALARPDLVRRALDKVKTDGVLEAVQQVRQRLDSPVPLGYSAAGTVLAVGEGIVGVGVGDRLACGGQGVAVHAELLVTPQTLIAPIPPEVSLEAGAFGMVGAIPLNAIRLARLQPGEWVAVIGLGLLGLLAVQLLRAMGCRVLGLDVAADRLALGTQLGTHAVLDSTSPSTTAAVAEITRGQGVDAAVILAATPSNAPLELAAQIARVRGRIVAAGLVGLEVPRQLFFERELELVVSRASGPGAFDGSYEIHGRDYPYPFVRWTHARNMAEFLRQVAEGAVKLEPLITHRFPIQDARQAYETLQGETGERPIGIVLQYPHEEAPRVRRVQTITDKWKGAGRGETGVGLIGAGLFAKTTLLPELQRCPSLRLIGVATASGTTARHIARSFGFAYAAADAAELIGDAGIQCIFVLTRHESHARLAAAALTAGKDVFVEKPLALSLEELLAVEEAWRKGGGRLMVGFNRRHSPHALAAKAFLDRSSGPILITCRVNAGDLPHGSWVNDPEAGGDRIRGELCHFADLAGFLIDQDPIEVQAKGLPSRVTSEPPQDVVATISYADGSIANLVYTARGDRRLPRERIEGFRAGTAFLIDNFRCTHFFGPGAPRVKRSWRLDRGYRGELGVWCEMLRRGVAAPVPFAAYAASTLTTLAVTEAITERRSVRVSAEALARCARPR